MWCNQASASVRTNYTPIPILHPLTTLPSHALSAHPHTHRLLRLVELPTLDGVMDHNAVDGKEIIGNASLSGRSLLDRAAARFRRSVKPDKKPPLPPPSHSSPSLTAMQQHTLTTTPHHTHRFSTRVKSDSQFQTHSGEMIMQS